MYRVAMALAVLAASPAAAQQMLPQQYRGADGKYEMCIKRHIIDVRKMRDMVKATITPADEIASAIDGCKKLQSPRAQDVLATIRECGVAVGDGSADQGCPQ